MITLAKSIRSQIQDSQTLHSKLELLLPQIESVTQALIRAYQHGGKMIVFGNGGSAADAQHIVAEMLGHFRVDRPSWPAIALTTNSSVVTAISNDYSYKDVFARQVTAWVQPNDVVIGITTSGKSANIIAGLKAARERGAVTVGMMGKHTETLQPLCDYFLSVPSDDTPRVQEVHILIGHILCQETERALVSSVI